MKKKQILRILRKRPEALPILVSVGLITLVLTFVLITKLINQYTPSKEHHALTEYYNISSDSQVAITLNHSVYDGFATIINGHVYLDYHFVHDVLNERFYWDANENILLYTTASDIISVKADESNYSVGKSSKDFGRAIVKATGESAWIDLEFVKNYSDFNYSVFDSPSRVVITNEWKEITVATLKGNSEIRTKDDIKSPILADVKKGDSLTILESGKTWSKVCTSDGIVGYVRSNKMKNIEQTTLTSDYKAETFNHLALDKAINFLFHTVSGKHANNEISTILSTTKGVDVLSPSWFKLKDNKGNITSYASTDYVTYAHNHDVEVWGMVKNFDLDSSDIDINYILTHTSARQNLVNQIVSQALQYNLDGITVNFKNLKEEEIGDAYIQFIRELSTKCEDNDIILSTAVYVPVASNSVYKYSEQTDFVDYTCIMAYEEHYGQLSGEGSVASYNWVKESIEDALAEGIPENQLLLGTPFYTKLWKLTPTSDENLEDVSYIIGFENLGLTSAKRWMNENISNPTWLEDCAQYYGETVKNGVTYKMWLEDESSIEAKLKLMQEYELAGAAFWNSDLDNTSIWEVIIKYIN